MPNSTPIKARILRDLHDSAIAGHPGVDRTYQSVRRWFWWRGMLRDITEYVHSCHSCQTSKSSNQLPAGTLQPLPIPAQRWLSISMDFITGLPKRQHYDSILVVVDHFSKMVRLMPCRETISARQTACLLFDHVLCEHLPESIISDRDTRFTSAFWKSLAALYETTLCMGTAYHPQSDGQTERMNRLLEETLRHFVDARQSNWPRLLAMAQFAINNAYNQSIKTTPFNLIYGRHPRIPLHATRELPGEDLDAVTFVEQMAKARQLALRAIKSAQDSQRAYANLKRRAVRYHVNDQVLLSTKHLNYGPGLCHGSRVPAPVPYTLT